MLNSQCSGCGGCIFRSLNEEEYRQNKYQDFCRTVSSIKNAAPEIEMPIFIDDGCRRRADMSFSYTRQGLKLGFNEAQSHNIADIEVCPMLTDDINVFLPELRRFLQDFCTIPLTLKNKKKRPETVYVREGDVRILQADNGIDILLIIPYEPVLEHRLSVVDFINANENIIRFSWQINKMSPETIVEKHTPELYIAGYTVEIPQGVFLQASKKAETLMIEKVLSYLGSTTGKIADLFCGLGTFTYPIAKKTANEVIAVDSSSDSLKGLQKALNRNQIHNVKVINRNLFKYPFDAAELSGVKAIVIDPPRAGAHEQCREISQLPPASRPEKIVFVSCNPKTFTYDAELLLSAGYTFERVTLIDQFVYSKHQELIALFTFNMTKKGE